MLGHPSARPGLDRNKSNASSLRLCCISIFILVTWFWLGMHWQAQLGTARSSSIAAGGGGCNPAEVAKAKAFAAAAAAAAAASSIATTPGSMGIDLPVVNAFRERWGASTSGRNAVGVERVKVERLTPGSDRRHASSTGSGAEIEAFDESNPPPMGITSMWWETEKGRTIQSATSRIMHAAVKSAVIYGRGKQVHVFSNSLPLDFFCPAVSSHEAGQNGDEPDADDVLSAEERAASKAMLCTKVRVTRYSIWQLTKGLPGRVDILRIYTDILSPAGRMSKYGYMHLISDIIRCVLV